MWERCRLETISADTKRKTILPTLRPALVFILYVLREEQERKFRCSSLDFSKAKFIEDGSKFR